ncbi:MAG: hypothetical protein HQ581_01195 [Planctomycetes bacterium]|nr:hypothetical protein [Planctomycetota bacterium]
MKEHPAPWSFRWGTECPAVFDADGRTVFVVSTGTIHGAYDTGDISQTGNAAAAALELLAACKAAEIVILQMADQLDSVATVTYDDELEQIRAAITKAEPI